MAKNPLEKKAQNEALFREVNERIEKVVEDAANPQFLCECADEECCETLELSIAEYEAIRSSPVCFPVKVGHNDPEVERVVEDNGHYVVAEKTGRAAEIVRERDPRSRS
jgi:hypothetical protein